MSDFHLLLQEELPKLMRYATALTRDGEEAGDLIEDVVREALANERRRPADSNLRVWLLTILHDLRDNPFRRATAPGNLGRGAAGKLTLSQLDRALGQLPELHRAVILLIGLEAMSYEDAAAILRVPVGTIRSRLSRARTQLRNALGVDANLWSTGTARAA
jgi:RNA polymerase sigma-70 factor, ECF subfamily